MIFYMIISFISGIAIGLGLCNIIHMLKYKKIIEFNDELIETNEIFFRKYQKLYYQNHQLRKALNETSIVISTQN